MAKSILPPLLAADESLRAIESLAYRLTTSDVSRVLVSDTTRALAVALPLLAEQFSVDEFDASWDEACQREVIRASIHLHRRKGTRAAVLEALERAGFTAEIEEWFETAPQGAPYTFVLHLLAEEAGPVRNQEQAMRIVHATKSLRSHFTLRLLATATVERRMAFAPLTGSQAALLPPKPLPIEQHPRRTLALANLAGLIAAVLPKPPQPAEFTALRSLGTATLTGQTHTIYPWSTP